MQNLKMTSSMSVSLERCGVKERVSGLFQVRRLRFLRLQCIANCRVHSGLAIEVRAPVRMLSSTRGKGTKITCNRTGGTMWQESVGTLLVYDRPSLIN